MPLGQTMAGDRMLGKINHSLCAPFNTMWGVGWEGGSGPVFRAIWFFSSEGLKKEGGLR